MRDFVYQNPTRIIFGKGLIRTLGEHIPTASRILVVAGGGSIKENGIYTQVKDALAGRFFTEFWGIEPNPDIATILLALERVRSDGIDFLLAVGGGSVIDATKFLAAIARTPGDPGALLTRGKFADALPIGVVLTLPGTGSESNGTAAISNRATCQKQIFSSPCCQPRFAILDPEVTYSLSVPQRANGIVDAYVHVLEQYLTFPAGGLLSDRLAEGILLTLHECGPKTILDACNYEVCANWMWSANLALNGLIGLGVPQDWTTHYIGHELTALYGIDHACTLSALLPSVLKARRKQKAQKLLQFGTRVLGITTGTEDERVSEAIARVRAFFDSLGLPTCLAGYGFTEDRIPEVVGKLKASRRIRMGERLDVTLEQVASILKEAI